MKGGPHARILNRFLGMRDGERKEYQIWRLHGVEFGKCCLFLNRRHLTRTGPSINVMKKWTVIKRGDLPISTERSILLNENTQSSYPHLAMWPLLRSWYFSYATIKLWVFYFEKVYITGLNGLVGVTVKKILAGDPPHATITTQHLDKIDCHSSAIHPWLQLNLCTTDTLGQKEVAVVKRWPL